MFFIFIYLFILSFLLIYTVHTPYIHSLHPYGSFFGFGDAKEITMGRFNHQAFIAEFVHTWPPALLLATLRCINHIAAKDSDQEVKDMAAAA